MQIRRETRDVQGGLVGQSQARTLAASCPWPQPSASPSCLQGRLWNINALAWERLRIMQNPHL